MSEISECNIAGYVINLQLWWKIIDTHSVIEYLELFYIIAVVGCNYKMESLKVPSIVFEAACENWWKHSQAGPQANLQIISLAK